jgi:hypothetical protein
LDAISAPTRGKARRGTETNRSTTVRLALEPLGTCAERARTNSATVAKNVVTESPASDHASKKWSLG